MAGEYGDAKPTPATPALRAASANRDLVRTCLAFTLSTSVEWALWVAVIVYAYDLGGATAAGLASLTLLVPTAVVASWGASLADGPRPNRVLWRVYALQALFTTVAAVLAAADAPAVVVTMATAAAVSVCSLVRPCHAVVVPGIVHTGRELTAGNLFTAWGDSASVLGGPLLAAALLSGFGTWAVYAAGAGLAGLATVLAWPLVGREATRPAPAQRRESPVELIRRSVDELRRRPGSRSVIVALALQSLILGALDLLYVVMAVELLDRPTSAAGWLSTAFGAGAVIGSAVSTRLVARRRLAGLVLIGVGAMIGGLVLTGASSSMVVALVLLAAVGAGRSIVDLTGRMLLQRSAPAGALAAVFTVVELFTLSTTILGSAIAQLLLAVSGPQAALWGVAGIVAVVTLVVWRALESVDAEADVPVVAVRLLRNLTLFAPLPPVALEQVARAAMETHVPAGVEVVRQGDPGDTFFAIADGEVEIRIDGTPVRRMARGDGFGEVALLADTPRTATVVSTRPTTLLAIDRGPFLMAVTGHDDARVAAWATVDGYLDGHRARPDSSDPTDVDPVD